MRLLFSFVGILVVVAIIMIVAKQQLAAVGAIGTKASVPGGVVSRLPGAVSGAGEQLSLPQASQRIQRNVATDVGAALNRGVDARAAQEQRATSGR